MFRFDSSLPCSAGRPAQSLTNLFRSKITPSVIEDCGPDWLAHPAKLRNASLFEAVGVDLLLLQCSPQFEEMERFAENIIPTIDP